MVITGIRVQGFQSHLDSSLEFTPGLNIIVGPSDSGKTAIIRAIRWVLHNEPTGDGFINAKAGRAVVMLNLDDGTCIERERGGRDNYYRLNGQPYTGFGLRVPDEITQAHKMPKVTFGDFATALNLSMQLDQAFLVQAPGSVSAKVLGRLAGTEAVDMAAKDTNGDIHRYRQEKARTEAQVTKLTEDLSQYDYLDQYEQSWREASDMLTQAQALYGRAERIHDATTRYGRAVDQAEIYRRQVYELRDLDILEDTLKTAQEALERALGVFRAYSSWERVAGLLGASQDFLETVAEIDAAEAIYDRSRTSLAYVLQIDKLLLAYGRRELELRRAQEMLGSSMEIDHAVDLCAAVLPKLTLADELDRLSSRYRGASASVATQDLSAVERETLVLEQEMAACAQELQAQARGAKCGTCGTPYDPEIVLRLWGVGGYY